MNTWTSLLDFTCTFLTIALALIYLFQYLRSPKSCQSQPILKNEVLIGGNLAKGLILVQKKQAQLKNTTYKIDALSR